MREVLEAFAVGDAIGMPFEFKTRDWIKENFGMVSEITDPSISDIHSNLKRAQVTDDTEQVVYLMEEYSRNGVSAEGTMRALLKWIEETKAIEKGYVGPSTLKAIENFKNGKENGLGTTCGSAMRVLAIALTIEPGDFENLAEEIRIASEPTHNTNVAMEAAVSLGFGYHSAMMGKSLDGIIEDILKGAEIGRKFGKDFVGASTKSRIELTLSRIDSFKTHDEFLDFLYYTVGTTMESNEVVPCSVAIFAYAKDDVWLAIRLGASIGGDTDTVSAISGALSSLYGKGHNIPPEILNEVLETNRWIFDRIEKLL